MPTAEKGRAVRLRQPCKPTNHPNANTRDELVGAVATLVGSMAALVLGAVLESARHGFGETNVAISLVFVVVVAASVGGLSSGAVVGITAGLAYNFFHTEPVHTLRILDYRDVITVMLFPSIGLFVGQLTAMRRALTRRAVAQSIALRHMQTASAMISHALPFDEVLHEIRRALIVDLGVLDVRFEVTRGELTATEALPTIESNGAIRGTRLRFLGGGFTLPEGGITIPVMRNQETLGYLVLTSTGTVPTTGEQRRTGFALAQLLALVLPSDGSHSFSSEI